MEVLLGIETQLKKLEEQIAVAPLTQIPALEATLKDLDAQWAKHASSLQSSGKDSSDGASLQSFFSSMINHSVQQISDAGARVCVFSDLCIEITTISLDLASEAIKVSGTASPAAFVELVGILFQVAHVLRSCSSDLGGWFGALLYTTDWESTPLSTTFQSLFVQMETVARKMCLSAAARERIRNRNSSLEREYFAFAAQKIRSVDQATTLAEISSEATKLRLPRIRQIHSRLSRSSGSFERSFADFLQSIEDQLSLGLTTTTHTPSLLGLPSPMAVASPTPQRPGSGLGSVSGFSMSGSSSSSASLPSQGQGQWTQLSWTDFSNMKKLGEGAYATVYEGVYVGERVAIKEIKYGEADAYAQHVTEVEVMSRLHSGYIVSMYGASIERSKAFIAMEFLPNGALFDYIINNPATEITWERRWQLACDTTLGLHYLHTRKPPLVHRDFKSHNLLLDANGRVKVCDFGLTTDAFPPPEGGCGTPRWLAPEVNAGQPYLMASDVYSLGIVLWEIAARLVVWGNDTTEEVLTKVAAGKRPPMPTDCPDDFADLIQKCWHSRPEARPTTEAIVRIFAKKGLLDNKVAEDKKVMADLQTKFALQAQELEISAQMKDEMQRRITSQERQLSDATADAAQARRTAEDLESRLRKESLRASQLEAELGQLRPELESQKLTAQKATKKLAEKKRGTERDLRQLKNDHAAKIEEMEIAMAKLRRELDRERRDKESLEQTVKLMTQR